MKKCISLLVLAATLFSPASYAGFTVYGPGGQSCGLWLEERKSDDRGNLYTRAWLAGYVTGVILALSGDDSEKYRKTDLSSMVAFIDKWCRENPLETVHEGANNLVWNLERK